MIKKPKKQVIDVRDWNNLIVNTYGKPYNFQQQNGCIDRGIFNLKIPSKACDFEKDTIPDELNDNQMGVSFASWLERDIKKWNGVEKESWAIDFFWKRNFYPDIQMVANDLYEKGLIPKGDYVIEIDW